MKETEWSKVKKAIFLDQDGTLIEDKGYVHRIEDFQLCPGVIKGLRMLRNDRLFFIITNQPGIGKGFYTMEQFYTLNDYLLEQLRADDIRIEKTYFCPHVEGCLCKKPSIKYIEEAVSEFGIDISKSWVIGDHPHDAVMGGNAGCKTVYLLTGHGAKHFQELEKNGIRPTIIAADFSTAADGVLRYELEHDHDRALQ